MRARCRVSGMHASSPARTPATVRRRLQAALEQWARRALVRRPRHGGSTGLWPLGACATSTQVKPRSTQNHLPRHVPTASWQACHHGTRCTHGHPGARRCRPYSRCAGGLHARCIVFSRAATRYTAGSGQGTGLLWCPHQGRGGRPRRRATSVAPPHRRIACTRSPRPACNSSPWLGSRCMPTPPPPAPDVDATPSAGTRSSDPPPRMRAALPPALACPGCGTASKPLPRPLAGLQPGPLPSQAPPCLAGSGAPCE